MPKATKPELKTVLILRNNCRKSGAKSDAKQAQKSAKRVTKNSLQEKVKTRTNMNEM